MEISYCIPCRNRTEDLKQSMVTVIAAARKSPPVEIVILNYSSQDDLEQYAKSLPQIENIRITYVKHTGAKYYHMAHARNLSMLAASGEYLIGANADNLLNERFFSELRKLINEGAIWMIPGPYNSLLMIQKKEFIEAGGYDERFEFYGPEDKELVERLYRRGAKCKYYPRSLIPAIYTPDEKKITGYRLKLSKGQMHLLGYKILKESRAKGTLVANPHGWGKNGCISNNTGT